MTSAATLTTETRSVADGRFPLSDEQRARVERDRMARDREAPPYPHHETAVLHLRGTLDHDALAAALDDTIGRHAALRLQIVRDRDGGWWQAPADHAELALERIDLTGLTSTDERDAALQRLVDEHATRPFDLERGPLIRATSIRVALNAHVLVVTIEHLVCDGWSLGVVMRDLGEAYSRRCGGVVAPRPPGVQFHDWVAWSHLRLRGRSGDALERWWLQRLAGLDPAPRVALSFARRPPATARRRRAQTLRRTLDAQLERQLAAVAEAEATTPFMLAVAALHAQLFRLTGESRLALPTPVAGRHWPAVEDSVGWFASRVVVIAELSGTLTAGVLRSQVRWTALEAYDHQDLPYARLLRAAHGAGTHGDWDAYDADVTFNHVPDALLSASGEIAFAGLDVRQEDPPRPMPRSTLAFTLGGAAGSTNVSLRFDTSELTEAQAQAVLDDYMRCLGWLVGTSATPLDQLELSLVP